MVSCSSGLALTHKARKRNSSQTTAPSAQKLLQSTWENLLLDLGRPRSQFLIHRPASCLNTTGHDLVTVVQTPAPAVTYTPMHLTFLFSQASVASIMDWECTFKVKSIPGNWLFFKGIFTGCSNSHDSINIQ